MIFKKSIFFIAIWKVSIDLLTKGSGACDEGSSAKFVEVLVGGGGFDRVECQKKGAGLS